MIEEIPTPIALLFSAYIIGSGTTAVACKKLNRNFMCSDINEDYVKIAESRLLETPSHETLPNGNLATQESLIKRFK